MISIIQGSMSAPKVKIIKYSLFLNLAMDRKTWGLFLRLKQNPLLHRAEFCPKLTHSFFLHNFPSKLLIDLGSLLTCYVHAFHILMLAEERMYFF